MILYTSCSVPGVDPFDRFRIVPDNWPGVMDWGGTGTPCAEWVNAGFGVNHLADPHHEPDAGAPYHLLIDSEPSRPSLHLARWASLIGRWASVPDCFPVYYGPLVATGARQRAKDDPFRRAEELDEHAMAPIFGLIAGAHKTESALAIDIYPWGGYTEDGYREWCRARVGVLREVCERHGIAVPVVIVGTREGGPQRDYTRAPDLTITQTRWQMEAACEAERAGCRVDAWCPIADARAADTDRTRALLAEMADAWDRAGRAVGR